MLLAGGLGLLAIKRESIPPVDFGSIIITTAYPGASPDEVETLITLKIEDELRGIDGIKEVRSVSRPGLSEIVVRMSLESGPTDEIADEVQRGVLRASDLPPELPAPPRVVRFRSGQIPVYSAALYGGASDDARDSAAELIQDAVEDLPGVAEVRLYGYSPREFTVLLDAGKLNARHVSVKEVTSALARQLRDVPGGYVKQNGSEVLVRALGKVYNAADAGNLIIRGKFGAGAVRLNELGRVVDARAEDRTLARLDGREAVLISVTKQDKADTVAVAGRVRQAMEALRSRLPAGMALTVYDDEAERVQERLHVVGQNAWSGLLLILVVLLVMLPGTIGVMAALSLPISILALAAFMGAVGLSFNVITMIAIVIVLGLFIDNSAVVAEAYSRNRGLGDPPREAAVRAGAVFFTPILATVLTNIAGFAPLWVTTGVMGQFVFSIPVVITGALLLSLFETFFLLPGRLQYTVRNTPGLKMGSDGLEAGNFGRVQRRFKTLVARLTARRYMVLGGITVLMLAAVYAALFLNRFDLFPKERTELYMARFETAPGSSLQKTDQAGAALSARVAGALKAGGVKYGSLVVKTGSSQTDPDDPQGKVANNAGLLLVNVPLKEAEKQNTEKVLDLLMAVPAWGLERLVFEAAVGGPPVGPPLNVICRSQDEEALYAFTAALKKELAALPGVRNLSDDLYRGPEEYQLTLDTDLLRRVGFALDDVGAAIQTALQGVVVSKVNIRSREVEVRVRMQDSDRATRADIEDLKLLTPQETLMPLRNLAKVRPAPGPVTRKRFNFQRAVTVSADVDARASSALALNAGAREAIARLAAAYPQVSTRLGGEEENTRESLRSLFSAMALSVLVILFILVVLNNSFGKALLVLSTIPLGLAGVSFVFLTAGRPLSFMALIGVIGLGGVIVNSAIVLVSFFESAAAAAPGKPMLELVAEVTAQRFKAVLVTNVTTIAGLFPTAYGLGGSDPLLVPLSLAMGWGLLAGSVLAIVWLPCGYLILHDLYRALGRERA